jgi:hypothetical protein
MGIDVSRDSTPVRPLGFKALALFFCFGSFVAAYAAATLFHPGTALDRLWALNRPAYIGLSALGRLASLPFVILSLVLLMAAIGWFRRQYWGWLLGVAVIATNLAADLVHALLGDRLRSGIGIVIASLLLFYLTRARVRTYFLPKI